MSPDQPKVQPTPHRDMTSSETAPDTAPHDEGFLESIGRAIGEVVTVPAGPDTIDTTPTETRDTERPRPLPLPSSKP